MSRANNSTKISVVIPNWNGIDTIGSCLDSLLSQSLKPHIIVVENDSIDGSLEYLQQTYPMVELVINKKNLGFAGGVNSGIRRSIERDDEFVALFNNDAVADKYWLENLVSALTDNRKAGIATCKFMDIHGKHLDSTGDLYSVWGLPYPRGRGEDVSDKYDKDTLVFGASGGASLYRAATLKEIGLFDEDFFAYYEDIDISFRAQLRGWKVLYVPQSIAYHQIGATSGKIKGFTTYQTIKNYPWVVWKNVPARLLFRVLPRFMLAYMLFCGRALQRKQFSAVTKGISWSILLLPKKTVSRWRIQKSRTVSNKYIWSIMTHDLPPNAQRLRSLRNVWRQMIG